MVRNLKATHIRITREIRTLERSLVAFQSGCARVSNGTDIADTSTAIILSARLFHLWKRIGAAIPPSVN